MQSLILTLLLCLTPSPKNRHAWPPRSAFQIPSAPHQPQAEEKATRLVPALLGRKRSLATPRDRSRSCSRACRRGTTRYCDRTRSSSVVRRSLTHTGFLAGRGGGRGVETGVGHLSASCLLLLAWAA